MRIYSELSHAYEWVGADVAEMWWSGGERRVIRAMSAKILTRSGEEEQEKAIKETEGERLSQVLRGGDERVNGEEELFDL